MEKLEDIFITLIALVFFAGEKLVKAFGSIFNFKK